MSAGVRLSTRPLFRPSPSCTWFRSVCEGVIGNNDSARPVPAVCPEPGGSETVGRRVTANPVGTVVPVSRPLPRGVDWARSPDGGRSTTREFSHRQAALLAGARELPEKGTTPESGGGNRTSKWIGRDSRVHFPFVRFSPPRRTCSKRAWTDATVADVRGISHPATERSVPHAKARVAYARPSGRAHVRPRVWLSLTPMWADES